MNLLISACLGGSFTFLRRSAKTSIFIWDRVARLEFIFLEVWYRGCKLCIVSYCIYMCVCIWRGCGRGVEPMGKIKKLMKFKFQNSLKEIGIWSLGSDFIVLNSTIMSRIFILSSLVKLYNFVQRTFTLWNSLSYARKKPRSGICTITYTNCCITPEILTQ